MSKKRKILILALTLAISLTFALTACKNNAASNPESSESSAEWDSNGSNEQVSSGNSEESSSTNSPDSSAPTKQLMPFELFNSLINNLKIDGEYFYDHSDDANDKTFYIETIFGGDFISQTESDKETGEVFFDNVYGKKNRRLTLITRTFDNEILTQESNELFENYYNPFNLLSADDFVKISDNEYSLDDKVKAKTASSAITGWNESIAKFIATEQDGKITKLYIQTEKIYRIQSSDEYFVSTYDFTVSEHGTAQVDQFKLKPYPHDASHDVLQNALTNASKKTFYTIRHQGHEVGYEEPEGGETRPGYGDTDYKVYVTEDMVYDSFKGEEHGYKLINGYLYPFDYNSAANQIVLTDPVDATIDSLKANFNGFKVELFKCISENVYIPHNYAVSSLIAPFFAVGNEKKQYTYATDFRIELKDGELYKVIFTYKTYGIEETVTLTFDFETENDFSHLNFEEAEKTSVLDEFIGQYKDEEEHFCNVDKSGFLLDGEKIEITSYGKDENGAAVFTGIWQNVTLTIMKFSSKQLLIQSDDLTVNYILTAVDESEITIPDEFKGTWTIDNEEENLKYTLIIQSRAIYLNGTALPLISYSKNEGLAAKLENGTLYVLSANEDETGKYVSVLIMNNDSSYVRFAMSLSSSGFGVEIPEAFIGTYISDDYTQSATITAAQITINGKPFIPTKYSEQDGFSGTYNSDENYYVMFYSMMGTVNKDKLVIGNSYGNYVLNRVASPKENYLGTWKSDPEISNYDYTVVFTETSLTINGEAYEINFDPNYGYKINWNDPSKPYTAYILFYYNKFGNPSMIMYDDNDLAVNLFKKETPKVPDYFIGIWKGIDETRNTEAEVIIDKNGNVTVKIGDGDYCIVNAEFENDVFTFIKDGKNWQIDYSTISGTINLFQADVIDATLSKTIDYVVPEALYGNWNKDDASVSIDKNGITLTLNGQTTLVLGATITVNGSGENAVYNIEFTLNGIDYSAEYGNYGTAFVIAAYSNGDLLSFYYLTKA